jgi:hypothetical protein
MNYYNQYPDGIDRLNCVIGYRIRPAWLWTYEETSQAGLIVGLSNDGISGIPGMLQLILLDSSGNPISHTTLPAGYPTPHQVKLTCLELPAGLGWEGTRLKAELIVKGVSHPVHWACRESLNPDGSLTLKRNSNL